MSLKNIEDAYPLSPMQQGMLFHSLCEPTSGVYVQQISFELHGKLNIAAFAQAWERVVTRHPVLRTAFVWENLEKPLQVVGRQVTLPWENQDWQGVPTDEQQQRLEALLQKDRQRGFELTRAPLMRLLLIQLQEISYYFIWSHHHLLFDGWSLSIIFKEVIAYYQAFCQDENLVLAQPRPYRDYIAWLQQQDLSCAEVFWRKQLSDVQTPTLLLMRQVSQKLTDQEESYDKQQIRLSHATTAALQSFAQQHQLTLNTLVQGAWALLLNCYSSEEDVIFGATVSGRPPSLVKADSMVGLFINTLPVRVQVPAEQFLLPWLQQLQAECASARQYEYTPLFEIQKWSDIPPGMPLFESIVVFENYPVEVHLREHNLNLDIRNWRGFEKTNYPLTLSAVPGSELLLRISYQKGDHFDTATIDRMLGHLKTLLEGMVANPQKRLKELSLLTEAERQLLVDWNDTQADYPQDQCIHELFEAQVERSPDAIAVIFEDQQLTYRELNTKANQLAHHLQTLGVAPEVLVGICVERSLEMVIALLGILKAGGAYVPLDPAYPQERLAFMLHETSVPVLLTQARLLESLPYHQAKVICLDADWDAISQQRQENPTGWVTINNLAYVIYTSGSTGRPKGAMNTHMGICNRLLWMQDTYQFTPADSVLQKTPFSFDVSVWEFFLPLLDGSRLVVAQPGGHQDSAYLVKLIAQEQITTLHFVPSMLQVFLQEPGLEKCKSLKRVICSGEALPFELQKRFFASLDAELHNLYGPTEAAIDVTFWTCKRQSDLPIVPIGRPIANTQIYLLDSQGQPVPIGVPGELHIGGKGLARGYLNRPELSAEKFISNPFSDEPGARLYKTGDLCRYLPDGNIEFLDRIDNQVKIRGFRIELGEIEAALTQHSAVRASVVVVREDEPGSKRLVAYVVPHPEQALTITELRRFLKDKLPEYMMPSAFMILKALPLTPNGKVNRQALPAPELARPDLEKSFAEPRTPIEEVLAAIWIDILRLEQVGIHDNFFELGGHSLLATQVISRLRKVFQVELPLRCLFESPTIAELAETIEKTMKAGQGLMAPPIVPVPREKNLPLSFAQQRLWFLHQLAPHDTSYNISTTVRLIGSLNVPALEQSLNEIVRRHEVLRTTFTVENGQPVQVIARTLTLAVPVVDLSEIPVNKQQKIRTIAKEEAEKPFTIDKSPLLRVTLLRLGEADNVVLFTMHHIISDGWSMGVIIREIPTLYEAFCLGKSSPLPELPIQYADFAVWQRQWLQGEVLETQLAYWKQLGNNLPVLKLPTDRPRPAVQTHRGARQSLSLDKTLSEALKKLTTEEGVTLFMTLLAAFVILLHYYSEQDDIVVGTDVANRNQAETEGLIGFFVNQLVLRTYLGGNPNFRELLGRVRDCTLGAYAHQDLPFDKLVEVLNPERQLSHTPLFQVKIILQNTPIQPLELSGLTLSPLEVENTTVTHDLLLELMDTEQGITGLLKYNTDLFEQSSITRMLEHFQTILRNITSEPNVKLNELKTVLMQVDKQQQIAKEQTYQNTLQQKLTNIKRKSNSK
ncbi:peptide synthetase [Scytonema sp. HK-05]|uniref:non-ribosomal peptide synthetase n=1 Tax=Scytonema sp. HK-05 TaxID=1137095 RepID=UPI0009358717|nr:non-ribosomal peptide synthetase [Scytonema sp. HK-05]OKH54663.1 non-ribosomal peptide synthetase [Scytonema sp. HK-05]BAY48984.1 peptide synthetase [Scytonema sp. HK-05]